MSAAVMSTGSYTILPAPLWTTLQAVALGTWQARDTTLYDTQWSSQYTAIRMVMWCPWHVSSQVADNTSRPPMSHGGEAFRNGSCGMEPTEIIKAVKCTLLHPWARNIVKCVFCPLWQTRRMSETLITACVHMCITYLRPVVGSLEPAPSFTTPLQRGVHECRVAWCIFVFLRWKRCLYLYLYLLSTCMYLYLSVPVCTSGLDTVCRCFVFRVRNG